LRRQSRRTNVDGRVLSMVAALLPGRIAPARPALGTQMTQRVDGNAGTVDGGVAEA
jgi:hypothetical protein